MRLDHLRWTAHGARFDHVRIKRSLHQIVNASLFFLDAMRFILKYCDKFIPDNLAFFLGIADTLKLVEKTIRRIDGIELSPSLSRSICCTLSNSFFLSTPLFTKMQVSRDLPLASRSARSTSTAATEESTPPESAQMARPFPTCCRTCSTVESMKCCGVHSGFAPQI